MYINCYQSILKPSSYFICVYPKSPYSYIQAHIYIDYNRHPIAREFKNNHLPLGILLDYIEDNKEDIEEVSLTSHIIMPLLDETIDTIRELIKDHLWKTLKEINQSN